MKTLTKKDKSPDYNTSNNSFAMKAALTAFIAMPFFNGLFMTYTCALFDILLLVFLMASFIRNRAIKVCIGPVLIATFTVPTVFLLLSRTGIDKTAGLTGAVRTLPVFLSAVLFYQSEKDISNTLLKTVPLSGAVITLLSVTLGFIPQIAPYIYVDGRLAGSFQYPNTFALFLLIGLSVTALKNERGKYDHSVSLILISGIILSGSRFVFVLMLPAVIMYILWSPDRKSGWFYAGIAAVSFIAAIIYAAVTGDRQNAGRIMEITFSSSTLIGRIIYWKDAVGIIIKRPLGLGYMGWYYIQGSIQTAVYSVMHVHNDLLQLIMDTGWIPSALCIYVFVRSLILNRHNRMCFAVLILSFLHILFDFDMQFAVIPVILVLCMNLFEGKEYVFKLNSLNVILAGIFVTLTVVFSVNQGASSWYDSTGNPLKALQYFPGDTKARIELLTKAETAQEMDDIADMIISDNDYVSVAYSAKARAAFARGDIAAMIDYKKKAIELNPYEMAEYEDYLYMLYAAASSYLKAGDSYSYNYCIDMMREVPEMLEKLKNRTSPLAYMINDKPVFTLSDEYMRLLESIKLH